MDVKVPVGVPLLQRHQPIVRMTIAAIQSVQLLVDVPMEHVKMEPARIPTAK